MRTGRAFVESLRDGRGVFLDGQRVKDVTTHAAFAEPIRYVASMCDQARETTGSSERAECVLLTDGT